MCRLTARPRDGSGPSPPAPERAPHRPDRGLARAIEACRKAGKYVGICGQGPSDHPDFAEWLVDQGITSISLNPDTVVSTWQRLGARAGK